MKPFLLILCGVLLGFALATLTVPVLAEQGSILDFPGGFSTFQDSSGLSGSLQQFPGGFSTYSDNQGRTGSIQRFPGGLSTFSITPPLRGLNGPC